MFSITISNIMYNLIHIVDWNAKVGTQKILRKTNKFGLRVQNEAGQKYKIILSR